jgi:hypothetical protein
MAGERAKRAMRTLIAAAAVLCGFLVLSLNPTRAAAEGDCVVPHSLGVAFVLDDSGSMSSNDPGALRGAAAGSAIDALPDGSVVAASKFTEEATAIAGPTVLDASSRPGLKSAVAAGLESFGGTDYDIAFTEAKAQLDAMTGVDKKAVVFLSDGEPNYPYTADQAIAAEGIPIFAVGFGEVPPAELSGIAARSGGQAFALGSAGQAQEIFARVVSALTCDVQLTTVSVNLKPGEQRKFPFHVQRGQRGFHGQVTWSSGELEVSLIRPDGSRLTQTAPRPNERFDATPNSASVSVTSPPPGKWQVLVRAPRQSVDDIKVHIDAWQREPPGSTSTEDPAGPPPPKGGEGCRYKASFGSLQLEASCFKIENGVLIASGRVRIDGLDIKPDSNVTIKLDPKTLQLTTTGEVTVSAGEVVLYKGKLDKTLQGHLPFKVPKALSKLKGFPLRGSADVSFDSGVANIKLVVSIPELGGVTGQVGVTASNSSGLQLGQASIDLPEARIKAIPIKEVHLSYERTDEGDKWSGSAKVELPSPTVHAVSGGATFLDGRFAEAHAAVDGNFPIAEAVFLTHLDASLKLEPDFAFGGGMGLSGGPKVGDIRAVGLDGHFDYTSGEPDEYKLSGNLKVVDKLELADGYVSYKTNGQFGMGGHLNFTIGGVGFEGDLGGFASGNGFELTGDGTVGYHGHGLGGKGIISSVGLAACGKLDFWVGSITAGFGVRWAHFDRPSILAGSCDLGPWKVDREGAHASALTASQTQTFRVGRRMPVLAFSAVGIGGPPNITVKGPDGTKATTPSTDAGLVGTPDTAAFADPEDGTTYILVRKPARGRWTVRVNSGPGVKVIRSAAGLPRPRVRAAVRGRGHDRRLVFSARKIRGQRLVFDERGLAVGARIGSSTARRGVLPFRPADGPRGKRRIFVSVLQRGLVRRRFAVATYKAPRPVQPRRSRGVRIVRHGMKAIVTWTQARGARSYDVRVKVSDGRRLLFSRKAHDRRVVVKGVLRQWRVRAAVVGVSAAGRPGEPSKATSSPQTHRRHRHRR